MMLSMAKNSIVKLEEERRKQGKNADTSSADSRMKQNPLGAILRDQLSWILHSDFFTEEQKKAAGMIAVCKTEALGGYLDYCPSCDKAVDYHYCSCNNRNCPNCQYPAQRKWAVLRKNEVIPGIPYYHIILTYPHELNPLIQSNPDLLLNLLMRVSARSVVTMCRDPKVLGAVPSILSVLHTWTSDLRPHFHAHMLVSGGGLNAEGKFVSLTELRKFQKQHCRKMNDEKAGNHSASGRDEKNDYFLSMHALSALFCGIFMAELRELYNAHALRIPEELDGLNDPFAWSRFCYKLEQTDWVGDLEKTNAEGENVIEYFARYAHRTAISNSRIVSYDGKNVEFTVRDKNAPNGKKTISLDVHTFIVRFLSHILPKGFTRVRTFGILSNSRKNKNLRYIYEQLKTGTYTPSPFQALRGIALMQALFPGKLWGICPYCQGSLFSIPFGQEEAQKGLKRKRKRAA